MNQKTILYSGLKTTLQSVSALRSNNTTMQFKTVELWRNNLERESVEQPFLYPACFIELLTSNYMELSKDGLQSFDMVVRLHICFESYKDEDIDIFSLVDATFRVVQYKQYGFFGKLKRRDEMQNFDHDNRQDYIQDYEAGKCKDFPDNHLVPAEIDTLTVIPEVIVITE